MTEMTLFKPKAYPARKPTDAKLMNGACANPPRYSQIGGLDAAHKGSHGEYKNNKSLRKPGGTK